MKNPAKLCSVCLAISAFAFTASADNKAHKLNPTTVEITPEGYENPIFIDFYGPNVFRLFHDPEGGAIRNPQASPQADILVSSPRRIAGEVNLKQKEDGTTCISTDKVEIIFAPDGKTFKVTDLSTGKTAAETLAPFESSQKSSSILLKENTGEYFYGGGVQNGRFSHKGNAIDIVNTNSWTDGGVASPTPFYWSTNGYGLMWHTFEPGRYDFGASVPGEVLAEHSTPYVDVFMMVDAEPTALLNDFYQLTGNPVLLPKFGFYEGHLNAYNRDFWKEAENGILFEDGKKYKESQKDNGGIKESLNGELPGNYQFSARAVIDRYNKHDMPLGWVLPNDGYGAGYGQTSTLKGNIENLKQFGEYARNHGVEIGLWTQSDLYPKDGIEPLLQRDIVREVRDAGVRVLKTDVAWVGAGYSFGLNGVNDVGAIMPYYGNDARPFIISLDGWAGTQRNAAIWTGDQTGGQWEYIRFHIPTYIGSGLSGQPNICSDMDGIFGGKNPVMNTRDFQWKTWTPLQLNMDGWGSNPKYPHIFGGEYENIVRAYLKIKSEIMPYAYTYAYEAIDGQPLMRAMFLDYPSDYTHGTATRYQFLYGPDMLVAPIYQPTNPKDNGADVRNGIYLPEGVWYDWYNGHAYTSDGSRIMNNFSTPLWKLPVFVKAGAIIPLNNPHNNPSQINKNLRIYEIWPYGKSEMTQYEDDGTSQSYMKGEYATTKIVSDLNPKGILDITVNPTMGSYDGITFNQSTEFVIPAGGAPKEVLIMYTDNTGKVTSKVKATMISSEITSENAGATWQFDTSNGRIGKYGVENTESLPAIKINAGKVNRSETGIRVEIKGYKALEIPSSEYASVGLTTHPEMLEPEINPYDITLSWKPLKVADQVQVRFNGMMYTDYGVEDGETTAFFEDLKPATDYTFEVRSVKGDVPSEWEKITLKTKANPLEFAIKGIKAKADIKDQPGFGLWRAFDFQESGDIWHTIYSGSDMPFELTMDLGSFNTLDRIEYLPRVDGGNGTILEGAWQISENGKDWSEPKPFAWQRNGETKTIKIDSKNPVRFIRLKVDKTVGRFASAREFYVFKVPGTPSFIPGDINKDGVVDSNDITSYMNYNGLRAGDGDFEYISMGDVNRNGRIDAFDIATAALQTETSEKPHVKGIGGKVQLVTDKAKYNVGEEVELSVKGTGLLNVYSMSFALPYDPAQYEFIGINPVSVSEMMNLTYDRLHTDGEKVLYPTFTGINGYKTLNGDSTIALIKFKAKKSGAFSPKAKDIILVSPQLETTE